MQECPVDSSRLEVSIDGIYMMTNEAFSTWMKTVDRADLRGIFTIDGRQFSVTDYTISYTHDGKVHIQIEARSQVFRYYDYNDRIRSWQLKGSSNLVNAPNS